MTAAGGRRRVVGCWQSRPKGSRFVPRPTIELLSFSTIEQTRALMYYRANQEEGVLCEGKRG